MGKEKLKCYDLNDLIFGDGDFIALKEEIKNNILDGLDDYRLEECIVSINDDCTFCIPYKEFVINLIFLQFLQGQDDKVVEEIYNNIEKIWFTQKKYGTNIPKYWDAVIPILSDIKGINIEQLNHDISDVITEFGDFLINVDMVYGGTINLYSFMKAIDETPELQELCSGDVEGINDYAKISKELVRRRKRFEEIMKEKYPELYLFLKCNNAGQYEQMFIGIGPKADIYGRVMPHVPNTNFLHGMKNIMDYYTLSQVTRKILIMTHKSVSNSGYLARKLGLLLIDTQIDLNSTDCGTNHYLTVEVDCEKTLSRLRHRWYRINEKSKWKVCNGDEESLIGKTIQVRSPITCAGKKGICKKCYGKMWKINKKFHIGILACLYLSSVLTQRLLSAKHLIKTEAPEFVWPDEILELFNIEKSTVSVSPEANASIFIKDEDFIEDEDTGMFYTDVLYIMKGKHDPVQVNLPDSFWLSGDLLEDLNELRSTGGYEIKLKDYADQTIFELLVKNEEMTSSLNKIKKIIDNKDHLGYDGSYNEMHKAILDILNKNNINIDSVHIELIVRELLVDGEDNSHRPDFSQDDPSIKILRLSDVVFKRETLSPALSFEHTDKQLNDPATFKKNKKSNMDAFYK